MTSSAGVAISYPTLTTHTVMFAFLIYNHACVLSLFSHVCPFVIQRIAAREAPPSMEFPRQE